jgi:acyl carrier protein
MTEPGSTDLEAAVRRAWSEHLELSRDQSPDLAANFFSDGGDSLSAARMMASLGDALGHPLGLRLLVRNPTLGRLCSAIREQIGAPESPASGSSDSEPGAADRATGDARPGPPAARIVGR